MLVEEQFGRTTDILIRRAFGNVYEILLSCAGDQIDRWLKPSVAGQRTCSLAFTEPDAGSDAAAIRTRAVRDGDGWILNGNKHFISDGLFSDFFVVTAVTDPQAGHRGISLFLVDKGRPGFAIGRDQKMMGLRGTSHVELRFENVRLSGDLPPLPASVFGVNTLAYELAYGKGLTPFLKLAKAQGAERLVDGVGMLVEQAAEAFEWWRGVRPDTAPMIDALTIPLE